MLFSKLNWANVWFSSTPLLRGKIGTINNLSPTSGSVTIIASPIPSARTKTLGPCGLVCCVTNWRATSGLDCWGTKSTTQMLPSRQTEAETPSTNFALNTVPLSLSICCGRLIICKISLFNLETSNETSWSNTAHK